MPIEGNRGTHHPQGVRSGASTHGAPPERPRVQAPHGHEPARRTQPLASDKGTRPLRTGSEHLHQAYSPTESTIQGVIKGISVSKNSVKLGAALAAGIVAEEKLKGMSLGKALNVMSSHLKTLGDAGNAVRGVISTAHFVSDVQQLSKNPKLLKDPKFLLQLGYDVAGTAGGALTDLKYADKALTAKGVFAGGKVMKLMGADHKLSGVVKIGKDGAEIFDKSGDLVQELPGDFTKLSDLSELKGLSGLNDAAKGVLEGASKVASASALGEFVGKAAPGLGAVFGTLGAAHDIQNIAKNGFTVTNSLDLASNVLQTVGSVAAFLPPPLDAAGGAMMLASAGLQIAELGIKHWSQIEHFAGEAAKDVESVGETAARDVASAGKTAASDVSHAAGSAWHAVTSVFSGW